MCLFEALYLCITGGGSKGRESLQYIAVELPSALKCTVREVGAAYMQKKCDVAEKAILAKKNLRKKCVNRENR